MPSIAARRGSWPSWTFIFRGVIGLAALSATAQAWVTYDWIDGLSEHCDYPEECWSSWLPTAFAAAEYLWILTVLAGGTAVVVGALLRRPSLDIAVLGGAWGAAFLSYCLTPMFGVSSGEVAWRVQWEGNPLFWGGPGFTLTALLMAAAATAFGWQFLRTQSGARRAVPVAAER
jgi:hypothetical protein